jgi:hypothetical protein
MKEQYVIKTRNDSIEEYLCFSERTESFVIRKHSTNLSDAYKFNSLDRTRVALTQQCVIDSKYKVDIYKVVQALEYVERGV